MTIIPSTIYWVNTLDKLSTVLDTFSTILFLFIVVSLLIWMSRVTHLDIDSNSSEESNHKEKINWEHKKFLKIMVPLAALTFLSVAFIPTKEVMYEMYVIPKSIELGSKITLPMITDTIKEIKKALKDET